MELALANDVRELERLEAALTAFCRRHRIPPAVCAQINLALEELFVNIVFHAGQDDPGLIHLRLDAMAEGIAGEVVDDGKPFNPLERPPPDVERDVESRDIGGLGVHLVRAIMTDLRYERRDGLNRLSFWKSIAAMEKGA